MEVFDLRAIQTQYRDYLFRSRLEARYAVFLDQMREKWDYELEGYDLDDGDRYLPDFWLPRLQCFLEIKGEYPKKREIRVARKLQFHTGHAVCICYDLPTENECIVFDFSDENGGEMTERFCRWTLDENDLLAFGPDDDVCLPKICDAARIAKQARFEYRQFPRIYGSRRLTNSVDHDRLPF